MGTIWTLLGMLVTMAAILALAWLATRWIGTHGMPGWTGGSGGERMRVLRKVGVGKNEYLALVRVLDRFLLLGVTGGSMTLLLELSETEAEEMLRQPQGAAAPSSFVEALKRNLQKKK